MIRDYLNILIMKKTIVLLTVIIFSIAAMADDQVVIVKSKIEKVTVFLGGAQVSRSCQVSPGEKTKQVRITDLSSLIDPKSIQVKSNGNISILSVVHQLNYLAVDEAGQEYTDLEKKREDLQQRISEKQSILDVYNQEEVMLNKNQSIGGQDQGVNVNELKLAADFFRTRLMEIKNKQIELKKTIADLNKELNKIISQQGEISNRSNQPKSEIVINISGKTIQSFTLEISYFVSGANWTPAYDVMVTDISKPIQIIRKGTITQATGEDWKNAELSLSTSNPSVSGYKPELTAWNIYIQEVYQKTYAQRTKQPYAAPSANRSESEVAITSYSGAAKDMSYNIPVSEEVQNQTSISYEIKEPYSIPSDGKEYTVSIDEISVPADFEYRCSPKLDKDVFLIAQIPEWEQYNFLDGNANLFFEGTYIGATNLNAHVPKDTLSLSMGRDKSILVERKKVKSFTSKQFIGKLKTITIAWEISVKNNKKQSIDLVLDDQFPVSNNKELAVEYIDKDGAKLNEQTGILTWKLKLDSSKSSKVNFKYSVSYPKDKVVILE